MNQSDNKQPLIPGTWTGASNPYVNLAYASNYNEFQNLSNETAWSDPESVENMLDSKVFLTTLHKSSSRIQILF